MQQFFSTIITIFCICTISNIERDYHLYRYLSMVTLGWDQPKPSYDFTTKNSGIYSSYPYDATSHSKEYGIPISTPVVHVFLNQLHTNQTKIGSNVINQLFKSGCTIHSPDMKVLFVRGDLLIVPNSATPAQATNLFFQKIKWECKISHIIGT